MMATAVSVLHMYVALTLLKLGRNSKIESWQGSAAYFVMYPYCHEREGGRRWWLIRAAGCEGKSI